MNIEIRNDIRSKLYEYVKTIGLNIEVIRYNKQSGVIRVAFMTPPTEEQVAQIRSHIPALEREKVLEGLELYDILLADVTPSMLDAYVDNNVVDLASARVFLKRLGKAVLFLKKLEE